MQRTVAGIDDSSQTRTSSSTMRREPRRTRHRCLGTYVSNGTIYDYWMVSPRKTALSPVFEETDQTVRKLIAAVQRIERLPSWFQPEGNFDPRTEPFTDASPRHSSPKYLVDRWFEPAICRHCLTSHAVQATALTQKSATRPAIGSPIAGRGYPPPSDYAHASASAQGPAILS